jgi:CoA-transferase family III
MTKRRKAQAVADPGQGAKIDVMPSGLVELLRSQGLDMPGVPATPGRMPADEGPTARWARSGLMWLTGRVGGPPLAPAGPVLARAEAAARAFDAIGAIGAPTGGEVAPGVDVLLGGRAALLGLRRQGATSANGTCRLVRAADGWIALSLARPDDVDLVGALLERELDQPPGTRAGDTAWAAILAAAPARAAADLVERARLLGLPAAAPPSRPGDRTGRGAHPGHAVPGGQAHGCVRVQHLGRRTEGRRIEPVGPARRPLVVDLSSLWAGPLCAHLLDRAGMRVVKVESTSRPDGARSGHRAFFDWLHAGHSSVAVDVLTRAGRAALAQLVARADVVIESSRPRALAQLGVDARATVAARPGVTWVSITGYGRDAGDPGPVAFGDDAAVAGGLVAWERAARAGSARRYRPAFCADAIADPLTGLYAACAARASVAAGGGHLLDVAMAGVAAHAHATGAGETPGPATAARRDARGWFVTAGGTRVPVAPPRPPSPTGPAAAFGADTRAMLAELAAP